MLISYIKVDNVMSVTREVMNVAASAAWSACDGPRRMFGRVNSSTSATRK